MNDDFINQFEKPKPPRPEFTATLYQRITQPINTSSRTRLMHGVALSLAMVTMIVTVLFTFPPARAFADSIIRQFQKGNYVIQTVNSASLASRLAGFTVLAPSYLPDGYTVINQPGEWTVIHENDGVTAIIFYDNQAIAGNFAISEQMHGQGVPGNVLNSPGAQAVSVRGQTGAWTSNGGKSILTWEENGITYMIASSTLMKDEILKVAESLGK